MARPPEDVWEEFERQAIATVVPIRADHPRTLGILPPFHRDPFDRLIVAQALSEGGTLIGSDARVVAYGVTRLW